MRLLAFFLLPLMLGGADVLSEIHAELLPMRYASPPYTSRGATPQFTLIKHQLRDYLESRLSTFKWNGRWVPDPAVFQEQLNGELEHGGLTCSYADHSCPGQSLLGYLEPITVEIQRNILVVKAGIGILCGFDESAYAYELGDNGWHRIWQSEQDDYREKKYLPQRFHVVKISPADWTPGADRSQHLVLTLGSEPWCSSSWHPVYYRVWKISAALNEPQLLLGGEEQAFPDDATYGAAFKDEVFFQYAVADILSGDRRLEIHHWVLRDDKLERTDPVAISPSGFAAFWIDHSWPEVAHWTAPAARAKLEDWHEKNKGPFTGFDPTLRCRQHPDVWQLSTHNSERYDEDRREMVFEGDIFFLVRWRPPDRFTMVSISDRASPDCTETDPAADHPRPFFLIP